MLSRAIIGIIGVLIITSSTASAQYGGGGGASFTILASFITTLSGQNPSTTVDGICGIERVTITLRDDGGTFQFIILEISKPTNVPIPPGEDICYYRITVPQSINALIERAEIHFKIPKTQLVGIDPDTVTLYKLNEVTNVWEALPTSKVEEDPTFVHYIATTDSFSFFVLSGEEEEEIEQPPAPFRERFTIEGFNVDVTLTDGRVDDMILNIEEKSLEIMLSNVNEDATLTIEIPRGLLDSLNPDGSDTEFTVMFDGEFADYTEEKDNNKRILSISIPAGTTMVTILGTFVIPEFGILALIVFATAIGSMIVLRRNNIKL